MLKAAREAGIGEAEFWGLTLAEFNGRVEASAAVLDHHRRVTLTAGWLAGALARAKRVPSLRKILGEDEPTKARNLEPREASERQTEFDTLWEKMKPALAVRGKIGPMPTDGPGG